MLAISTGMLICFGRPSYLRRVSNKTTDSSTTPRSLYVNQNYNSALGIGAHNLTVSSNSTPYGLIYPPVAQSPTGDPTVSISSFYNQDRVCNIWLYFLSCCASLQSRLFADVSWPQPFLSGVQPHWRRYEPSKVVPIFSLFAHKYVSAEVIGVLHARAFA